MDQNGNEEDSTLNSTLVVNKKIYSKPKQEALANEISIIESQLVSLQRAKEAGLSNLEDPDKLIKQIRKYLDNKNKSLKATKNSAIRQKKFRVKQRQFLKECAKNKPKKSVTQHKIHVSDERGRQRIEDDQPDFLETIAKIAMFGASAADKRRSEILRSCKTLTHIAVTKSSYIYVGNLTTNEDTTCSKYAVYC